LGTALALGERGGKWQMENGKWKIVGGARWRVEAPLGEPEVGAVTEHPPSRLGTALALGERGGKWQMADGKWKSLTDRRLKAELRMLHFLSPRVSACRAHWAGGIVRRNFVTLRIRKTFS